MILSESMLSNTRNLDEVPTPITMENANKEWKMMRESVSVTLCTGTGHEGLVSLSSFRLSAVDLVILKRKRGGV